MQAESYYSPDGDIAYIAVRWQAGTVRTEREPWGLRDFDQSTGELVGIEVWSASTVLGPELIEALPHLQGRRTIVDHTGAERQPA